ncbi:hypothetical protein BJ742DRAFT_145238 [Cladochytrium replicatum]|nr:hypothetical protein BJ742DRAFT_145238 [Cladochytrium replicatum]
MSSSERRRFSGCGRGRRKRSAAVWDYILHGTGQQHDVQIAAAQPPLSPRKQSDNGDDDDDDLRFALERIKQLEEDERLARELSFLFNSSGGPSRHHSVTEQPIVSLRRVHPEVISLDESDDEKATPTVTQMKTTGRPADSNTRESADGKFMREYAIADRRRPTTLADRFSMSRNNFPTVNDSAAAGSLRTQDPCVLMRVTGVKRPAKQLEEDFTANPFNPPSRLSQPITPQASSSSSQASFGQWQGEGLIAERTTRAERLPLKKA